MASDRHLSPLFHEHLVMPLTDDPQGNARYLNATVAFLRVGAAFCVHLRWDALSIPSHPGSRRPVPTPYSFTRPGIMIWVPANPLQVPIVFIAQRLDGVALGRRLLVVVTFYPAERSRVLAIEAQIEVQWLAPPHMLTARVPTSPELSSEGSTPAPSGDHRSRSAT
ncbi:hypothetical protein C8Q76DRAFT_788937 [Earliella scabrosa]|nr:hypothetical protein C8Q76DRAFT_788937 [Earliella scabrosa]